MLKIENESYKWVSYCTTNLIIWKNCLILKKFVFWNKRKQYDANVRKRVYCFTIWLQLMVFVDPACRCIVLVGNFSKQTHAQSWPNTEQPKCFESWAAHFGCGKFNSWSHIVQQYTRFRTSELNIRSDSEVAIIQKKCHSLKWIYHALREAKIQLYYANENWK